MKQLRHGEPRLCADALPPAAQVCPRARRRHAGYTGDASLPSQVFADLRGNHDSFTVPQRGGPDDPYATWGWSSDLVSDRSTVRVITDEHGTPHPH